MLSTFRIRFHAPAGVTKGKFLGSWCVGEETEKVGFNCANDASCNCHGRWFDWASDFLGNRVGNSSWIVLTRAYGNLIFLKGQARAKVIYYL